MVHLRPERWETKHLRANSPESINIKVNDLLQELHCDAREIRHVSITSRDHDYSQGNTITHYDAWIVYSHLEIRVA